MYASLDSPNQNYKLKFRFYIGGYFEGYKEVIYEENKLVCFISDYPMKPSSPTLIFSVHDNSDWKILLGFIEALKWKPTYNSPICDGTQWRLEVTYNETKIKSYGSNSFPREFNRFLKLLNKISSKHGIEF